MTTVIKAITVALVIQPARLEAITAGFIRMRAALAAVPVLGGLFLKMLLLCSFINIKFVLTF